MVRSCLQYRIGFGKSARSHQTSMHDGCQVIKLDAYDSARNRISVCLRFDIGNNAYAPGTKKKARNRFQARERWSWHSSFGSKRD